MGPCTGNGMHFSRRWPIRRGGSCWTSEAELAVSRRRGKYRVIAFNREPLETLLERWLKPDGRKA